MAPGRSIVVLVRLHGTEYADRKDHPEGSKCGGGSRTC